jgi:DivIVA domain-containing protein
MNWELRTTRSGERYDVGEVDDFLADVERALNGASTDITAAAARDKRFTPVRMIGRGYGHQEVDDLISRKLVPALEAKEAAERDGRPLPARPDGVSASAQAAQAPVQLEPPRFTGRRFGEGYSVDEVDEYVDRVLTAISRQDGSITPEEVMHHRFTPTRFGGSYDMDEVDNWLDNVAVPHLKDRG